MVSSTANTEKGWVGEKKKSETESIDAHLQNIWG